ncbi:MAG: tRNA (guanosine(37)-N1)-methyltransferase TrmD [bacterium]|nr:tRNA (guanosine(37)-N1)-methyltransferase TrmD [bacterium]
MSKLTATFISLFPESIRSIVQSSILGKAVSSGILQIDECNMRDFANDKHKTADDSPCGGGPGQLIKIDVAAPAIRSATNNQLKKCVILTDPSGKIFSQDDAKRLAKYDQLVFVCGRYEGIDSRIHHYVDEVFSIGDFVLTGGELPALVMLDAIIRCIPGVLGNESSAVLESHEDGLLEESQYTRPIVFENHSVPTVLLSGDHKKIESARLGERLLKTKMLRPDLFSKINLSKQDEKLLLEAEKLRPFAWEKINKLSTLEKY